MCGVLVQKRCHDLPHIFDEILSAVVFLFRFNFVFTRILTILHTRLVILPKDMKKYFLKLQEFWKKNAPLELEIIVKHINQWTWKDTSLKTLKLNYRKYVFFWCSQFPSLWILFIKKFEIEITNPDFFHISCIIGGLSL